MRVADRVHRIGSRSIVNAYLVEDGGEVTIVDAGRPGHWRELPAELAAMGREPADVRAVVLTHGHGDHIGFAERARRELAVPVAVHEADAALARGEVPNPARGLGPWRAAPLVGFLWYTVRTGARPVTVREVATFGDGATLDVPGSPRVVHVPGHTPGSAALHLADRSVVLVGDALCTYAVTTGERGPRLAPFTADREQALASLARLHGLDAETVLPGHGDPWALGIDSAIASVRGSTGS